MTPFRLIIYEDVMFYQLPLEMGMWDWWIHCPWVQNLQYIFKCAAFMQFGYPT
jgi:hypothetical protein